MPILSIVHKAENLGKNIEVSLGFKKEELEALFAVKDHLDALNVSLKTPDIRVHKVDDKDSPILDEDGNELDGEIANIVATDKGLLISVQVGVWCSAWTDDLQDTVGEVLSSSEGSVTFSLPYPKI